MINYINNGNYIIALCNITIINLTGYMININTYTEGKTM